MRKPVNPLSRWWPAASLIGAALAIGLVFFRPMNLQVLSSHANPTRSYAEAVRRIEALRAAAPPDMNPDCQLQFLNQGQKAERAIAFVHGYSYCPQQFQALGQRFHDLGYNVIIAPLPHHGLADRLTTVQAQLTAEELATYADEMTDILQGLGTQTIMAGISGGGVTTAWAAQFRHDLSLAVVISPGFGFRKVPAPLTAPAADLFLAAPNFYQWWDPNLKTGLTPDYVYPRYSTRALAQILRLGFAVRSASQATRPAAQAILVVTNAYDDTVDNTVAAQVAENWRRAGAQLATYEFPADLRLGHDMIDPTRPDQRVEVVYPQLIKLIAGQ